MYLMSPLVEVFRYTLTPIAPFTWFGVPLSSLDVVAAFRLCILLRQLREMAHSKHVLRKGKAGVESKSFMKALVTTLLVVYGGEAIVCRLSFPLCFVPIFIGPVLKHRFWGFHLRLWYPALYQYYTPQCNSSWSICQRFLS